MIRANGARDEADLRRRVGIVAEAHRLQAQREAIEEEIVKALAQHEDAEHVSECLDAGHDLKQMLDDVNHKKQQLRTRQGKVWEERGALVEQFKVHSGDRRLAAKRAELAAVSQNLKVAKRRWRAPGHLLQRHRLRA